MSGIILTAIGSMAGAAPIPNGGHLFEGKLEDQGQVSTTWTAPANVTQVSVVCIGAGFQGGGALAYKNAIEVVPGNSYVVKVGAPGAYYGLGDTYFINTTTVLAGGGYHNRHNVFVGDGGGEGGESYHPTKAQGSGGAGGYSGNGGAGGMRANYYTASGANQYLRYTIAPGAGSGGGGGGGGGRSMVSLFYYDEDNGSYSWEWNWETADNDDASGCVGVYGQGSSGAAGINGTTGTNHTQGGPGSGGESGAGTGKKYGGGSQTGGLNGRGALRIMWGEGRAFPSTNATQNYGGVTESLD